MIPVTISLNHVFGIRAVIFAAQSLCMINKLLLFTFWQQLAFLYLLKQQMNLIPLR
jgi:hypothetical protein